MSNWILRFWLRTGKDFRWSSGPRNYRRHRWYIVSVSLPWIPIVVQDFIVIQRHFFSSGHSWTIIKMNCIWYAIFGLVCTHRVVLATSLLRVTAESTNAFSFLLSVDIWLQSMRWTVCFLQSLMSTASVSYWWKSSAVDWTLQVLVLFMDRVVVSLTM